MKYHYLLLCGLAAVTLSTSSASAALIASESFDYTASGYTNGLIGYNGGTGFQGAWKNFGSSNLKNSVTTGNVTVTSTVAPAAVGNHATVASATLGTGVGRNLTATIGADNTTVWLSYRTQNNNSAATEEFVALFTTMGEARSTIIGATRYGNINDGKFDVLSGRKFANFAARDTASHFLVVRFDFGVSDNDTVTIFSDPTSLTDFFGTGNAQITGMNAAFDGIGMQSGNATLQIDEILIGQYLSDVTTVPEPSASLLGGLGFILLLRRRR